MTNFYTFLYDKMIHKVLHRQDDHVQMLVTFTLPNSLWADHVYLVGDFNDWDRCAHPMQCNRAGEWVLTVDLEPGRTYQFRYLIDGHSWTNDDNADAYVRNLHGSDNFIVITDPNFEKYQD